MELVKQAIVVLNNKAIPELSIETKAIYERLKIMEVDEVVLYEELSKIIGRSVQKYRGNLASAVRLCLHEHIVIECVRNVGVKRLSDITNIATTPQLYRKKISRMARKARKKITSVDYDALPKDAQVQHNAALSVLGAVSFFTNDHQTKTIEGKVAQALKPLPIGKTLEIFK